MPSTRFLIKMDLSGECDVHRDGRRVKFDLDDVDEALAWIKRKGDGEPGEQVTIEEPDGYRTKTRLR